jgi:hypothetical protein
MSKTSVAQGLEAGQEGRSPDGGAVPFVFPGGQSGSDRATREEQAEPLPPQGAKRAQADALGLDPYKTSDGFIAVIAAEARLKRVRHAVMTSARLLEVDIAKLRTGGFRWKPVMVTLTYRPGAVWNPRDVSNCLRLVREYLQRREIPFVYCWVAEIQEHRAETRPGETALHYHVLLWLPYGVTLPKPDKQGWWTHGSTNIEWARKPVGYMAKYASKGGCLDYVPSGARMNGFGGLSKPGRVERAWWMSPAWVRERWSREHRPCRAQGGGWMSRLTGELIASPWMYAGTRWVGGVQVVLLMAHTGTVENGNLEAQVGGAALPARRKRPCLPWAAQLHLTAG